MAISLPAVRARFLSVLSALLWAVVAYPQCVIGVESGAPFCAGEGIQLTVPTNASDSAFVWTSSPACPGCFSNNSNAPVFTPPPPSDGTDYTIDLTVYDYAGSGGGVCDAVPVVLAMDPTPFAGINGIDPTPFNGLIVFTDCDGDVSADFTLTDACQNCAGATLTLSINGGAFSPVSAGWSNVVNVSGDLQEVTYVVNNGTCADTGYYGLFVGDDNAPPPGGSFEIDQAPFTCIGEGAIEFTLNSVGGVEGTQYTIYSGESTTPYLQYSFPPPPDIPIFYTTSSCDQSSPQIPCQNGPPCQGSTTGYYSVAFCISNPCNGQCYTTLVSVVEEPTASFTVNPNPTCVNSATSINGTVTGQTEDCEAPDIQWTITPDTYTPQVLPNAEDITVTFTEPGSYSIELLVLTGVDGCDTALFTQTVCVESPPVADITVAPPSGCAPLDVLVTFDNANVEDCPQPLQYQWTVSAFGSDPCQEPGTWTIDNPTGPVPGITFTGPGTYLIDVDVVDPGCPLQSDQQTVTVGGLPLDLAFTVTEDTICEGETVTVNGSVINCDQGPATIDWTMENGTPATFTGANPGAITFSGTTPGQPNTITITATNGCPGAVSQNIDIWVTAASAPIDPQVDVLQICPGEPITVSFTATGGVVYGWNIPGTALSGTDVTSPFTITATQDLVAGNYTIAITSNATGCGANNATVDFAVQAAENVVITGPTSVCEGGSVDLTVTGATDPAWSTSEFTPTITVTPTAPSGTYSVTSAGAPGLCPGSATTTVTVIDFPLPSFTFTNDPCTGVDFTFTNTTAGGPYDWSWSAPGANPPTGSGTDFTTSFPDDTSYDVTLTASTQTTPACPTSTTQTVTVVDGPTVDVTTTDVDVCLGSVVVDLQADVTGTNLTYMWSTSGGSGGPLNVEDAGNFTFNIIPNAVTIYDVTLTVDNPTDGCGAVNDSFTVTLNPDPTANFTVGLAPCAGVPYLFPNTSSTTNGSTWVLDGGAPNLTTDLNTALSAGPHDITLTVSTNTVPACVNSITQTVNVEEPPTINLPLASIDSCAAALTLDFAPSASGNSLSYAWDFGAGASPDTSNDAQPLGVFFPGDPLAAVSYTVNVFVDNPNDVCPQAQDAMTITILPFPISVINTDLASYCEGDTALLTQVGEGIVDSCRWVFSDAPLDTFVTVFPDIQIEHQFPLVDEPTDFTITCLVHNPCGVAVDVDTITVIPTDIVVATHTDVTGGCAPLTVTFENNTAFDLAVQWFMPGGTILTDPIVQWTFDTAGTFQVIARSYACGFDEDTITIVVDPSPDASFSIAPDTLCANLPVTFTNTATGTGATVWYFGDGDSSLVATPTHAYANAGTYDVVLVTGWSINPCTADTTAPVTISPSPSGAFTFGPEICAPDTVCFDLTAVDADTYAWDFGNISAAEDPCNVYTQPGTFAVGLTLTNNAGCILQLDTVLVVDTLPIAAFTALVEDPCHLPAQAVFANSSVHATGYIWDFGTLGSSTATDPVLSISTDGSFPIVLTALGNPDIAACFDQADTTLIVYPVPLAAGEVLTDPACTLQPVLFDASASVNGTPFWSLGDGTTSDQSQFTHVYALDTTYLVHLTVSGAGGCTDTLDAPIEVIVHPSPTASFTWASDDQLSEIIRFENTSQGAVRYFWDFGDGSTSEEEHPTHRYNLKVGDCDWTVTLVVTSAEGCVDSTARLITAPVSVVYFMANAFTPNGQGPDENERFAPDFVAPLEVVRQCDYHLTIFDRWGHPLFETTDPTVEWDGNFPDGNPVPQGPYTWAVHLLHPCIPVTFVNREGHVGVVR